MPLLLFHFPDSLLTHKTPSGHHLPNGTESSSLQPTRLCTPPRCALHRSLGPDGARRPSGRRSLPYPLPPLRSVLLLLLLLILSAAPRPHSQQFLHHAPFLSLSLFLPLTPPSAHHLPCPPSAPSTPHLHPPNPTLGPIAMQRMRHGHRHH